MIEGKRIFVTGASGFIGGALVERLVDARCKQIICLSRSVPKNIEYRDGVELQWVHGDLLEPSTYQNELRDSDAVIHLAATTGKHTAAEHRRVNLEGTKSLIASCRETGVRRLVFVSTVAAGYEDLSDYPYAKTKRDAETAVGESGLDATIVRPTIVLGQGSSIGESLMKFSMLPLVPVFGNGNVLIQPIHVDDVASGLVEVALSPDTIGKTIELGGNEVLEWNEWFRRAKQVSGGRKARLVHLPLWLILPVLRGLERLADGKLPVTAGQLSAFRHNSNISGNTILDSIRGDMRGLDIMFRDSLPASGSGFPESRELDRECEAFARHLVGRGVSDYLLGAYRRAHEPGGPLATETDGFESQIVNFARRGGWRLSVADAYARMFLPTGALRRKLVLAMALLENSADGADQFNLEEEKGLVTAFFAMTGWGMRYAFLLTIGMAMLGPRHLIGGRR